MEACAFDNLYHQTTIKTSYKFVGYLFIKGFFRFVFVSHIESSQTTTPPSYASLFHWKALDEKGCIKVVQQSYGLELWCKGYYWKALDEGDPLEVML